MNYNELVSIIVPVYNVELYLDRCLDSLVKQTYSNIEIILVDDGSTDTSSNKCEEWQKTDSRIKVIHKKNEGLGLARNTGINKATGSYICFVDSDDFIDCTTVEKSLRMAQSDGAEIVVYGYTRIDKHGNTFAEYIPDTEQQTYVGKEVIDKFLPDLMSYNPQTGKSTNLQMSSCMMLFSLKMIKKNSWEFVSERRIISEDYYSLLYLFSYVNAVSILKESLYYYCENINSLTQKYDDTRLDRIQDWYLNSIELCNKLNYSNKVKERLSIQYLANDIAAMKQLSHSGKTIKKLYLEYKKIVSNKYIQEAVININLKVENFQRKILFLSIKLKLPFFLYVICKLK